MIPTPEGTIDAVPLEQQVAFLSNLILQLQERLAALEWRTQHFGYGQPFYPTTPYTTYSDGKGHGMWPDTKIRTSPASDN